MSKLRILKNAVFAIVVAVTSLSCSEFETIVENEDGNKVYTANLVFDCAIDSFDAPTRSTSISWDDESQVFLQFSVGEGRVQGCAMWDADTDKWKLEFYGEITQGQELNCHAYYFENALDMTYDGVTLNETSIVYRDESATYFYDGETLTVNAHLLPVTGRVRFEGEPGAAYNFFGPTKCTYYNFSTNELSTETKEFVSNIPESGKSGYYYVYFNEYSPHEFFFYDQKNNARYAKKFIDEVLSPGSSGYIDIPTIDSHNSWRLSYLKKTYTVGDVSFNMILVDKGTFAMGWSKNPDYCVTPVHNVTLTKDYYIGETEVTQDLWKAVMTAAGTTSNSGDDEIQPNYPKGCDFSSIGGFLNKLNSILGSSFDLPTEAQWEFAAKGGNKSKDYIFSGSHNLDDVAWIEIHEVKTKQPNELGIYDMSGNAIEVCGDDYTYSKGDAVDPIGSKPGTGNITTRGGYAHSSSSIGKYACTGRQHGYSSGDGFRLASY